MSVKWTDEQKRVIDHRGKNLLVSAAAGSGKTAVLVERIISMITRKEDPVSIDELLVVTFTEAAAAEMKERIRLAIEERILKNPGDEHLRRQATFIHSAQITTIHSFCLSVIREHFHVIDLDPSFRVAEEGELKLLLQDVMKELLESCYQEKDARFMSLVEGYGGTKNDRGVMDMIEKLYRFSRSNPLPETWLKECVKAYVAEDESTFDESPFFQEAFKDIRSTLQASKETVTQGLSICRSPDGPYMYEKMLESDLRQLEHLLACETYTELYDAFSGISWMRMSSKKDPLVSDFKRELVKKLRDQGKGQVQMLQGMYFYQPMEEMIKDLAVCRPVMEILAELTILFRDLLKQKKQARNLIDFDDMQEYALQILTKEEDGKLVPSQTARGYQKKFREVMIDEYQDSNLIQEVILTSVSRVSAGTPNIFMVGDVKQSIYRFRLARPELFIEKYDRYNKENNEGIRIDLHRNFRSRREVVDVVNAIFEQIMVRALGGVDYDARARLIYGEGYEDVPGPDGVNVPELILCGSPEEEAQAIVLKIRELMADGMVMDKETKALRPLQYRDIVILLRSVKGFGEDVQNVLRDAGIPVYTGVGEGYFQTQEIGVFLDYLRILNNRRQDIPMAGVLTSCFGHVSEEELAQIKSENKTVPFWKAVFSYAECGPDEALRQKLGKCLEMMESFRKKIPYMALHELLGEILDQTGYRDYVTALPAGQQRQANLYMLEEKAKSFEKSSFKGLFNFIRYIEQLQKYEIDYGEASVTDEQSDVVRMMTIHKSKGLEFPVVILAGCGKGFNKTSGTGNLILHAELGVGLECINIKERTACPSFPKKVISRQEILEGLGEELRVLYVALTRAKEKLVMTGHIKETEEEIEKIRTLRSYGSPLGRPSYGVLTGAGSFLAWILSAAENVPEEVLKIRLITADELALDEQKEEVSRQNIGALLKNWNTEIVYDEAMHSSIREKFSYTYPYDSLEGKKFKFTVSELKKRAYLEEEGGELPEEETPIPLIPKFLQEDEAITGSLRGTAYHRVMELLDFTSVVEGPDGLQLETWVRGMIDKMVASGKIAPEIADCVRPEDVAHFLGTASGKRMRDAAGKGRLWKEQPFVLGVSMKEVYPENAAEPILESVPEEYVLVQGIIDVWFEEPDGLVVLDYKTDKIFSARALADKYRAQLAYYAKALEQITGKHVKEKIIYSFTLKKEIKII